MGVHLSIGAEVNLLPYGRATLAISGGTS